MPLPQQPGLHAKNGTVVRLIDFAAGLDSPMHRAMSLDYGVVIEGEFEITLDSGESRIMRPGDVFVQRATFTSGATALRTGLAECCSSCWTLDLSASTVSI
ncbi:hypothetical protein DL768_009156 [Monosporascus sp. mg162]|nr:hypothetical protein DL768_009156 [Monosporascus sp. mg162]